MPGGGYMLRALPHMPTFWLAMLMTSEHESLTRVIAVSLVDVEGDYGYFWSMEKHHNGGWHFRQNDRHAPCVTLLTLTLIECLAKNLHRRCMVAFDWRGFQLQNQSRPLRLNVHICKICAQFRTIFSTVEHRDSLNMPVIQQFV